MWTNTAFSTHRLYVLTKTTFREMFETLSSRMEIVLKWRKTLVQIKGKPFHNEFGTKMCKVPKSRPFWVRKMRPISKESQALSAKAIDDFNYSCSYLKQGFRNNVCGSPLQIQRGFYDAFYDMTQTSQIWRQSLISSWKLTCQPSCRQTIASFRASIKVESLHVFIVTSRYEISIRL